MIGARMGADPRYSVVVPVYNEEESLLELGRRLAAAFDELDGGLSPRIPGSAAARPQWLVRWWR